MASVADSQRAFLRDGSLIGVGTILYSVGQWALLAYLARSFGVATVGDFAIALSILSPLFTLSFLGYRTLLSVDARHELDAGLLLAFRFASMLASLVLIVGVLWLYADSLARSEMVLVVAIAKSVEGLSDLAYGAAHRDVRGYRQGISLMMRSVLGAIAFLVGAKFLGGAVPGLGLLALSWFGVFVFFDVAVVPRPFLARCSRSSREAGLQFAQLAARAAPLVFSSVLGSFVYNLPRYAVDGYAGGAALGVFALLASFGAAGNLACAALGQALLPRLSRAAQGGDSRLFAMLLFYPCGLVLLGGGVAWFGASIFSEEIVLFFFGQEVCAALATARAWQCFDDDVHPREFGWLCS